MNVRRAFGFVVLDPGWLRKLAVAAGLLLVPIVGWLLVGGYWLRVARAVAQGVDVPLPAWDGWIALLVDGAKGVAVAFLWNLLPTAIFLVPNVASGDGSPAPVLLASFLLNLVAVLMVPAALGRVAVRRSFLAGIEGGPVVRMVGRNARDYLLILLMTAGVVLAWSALGTAVAFGLIVVAGLADSSLALGIAMLLAGAVVLSVLVYVPLVFSHLYGQAYYRAEPSAWQRSAALN